MTDTKNPMQEIFLAVVQELMAEDDALVKEIKEAEKACGLCLFEKGSPEWMMVVQANKMRAADLRKRAVRIHQKLLGLAEFVETPQKFMEAENEKEILQ